jgi:hypothetical protein
VNCKHIEPILNPCGLVFVGFDNHDFLALGHQPFSEIGPVVTGTNDHNAHFAVSSGRSPAE